MLPPERSSRSTPITATIAVSLILLFAAPAIAKSVETNPSLSQAGSPYEMILCGSSASFELDVTGQTITMVEVASGHEGHAFPKSESFDFKKEGNNKVYIAPTAQAPLGATASLRLWLPNGREATIHAHVVADLPVQDNVLLYHQSERRKLGLMDKPNPCVPRSDRAMDRLIARATERHAHGPIVRAVPVIEGVTKSGHALDISILLAEWEGDDMVLDFEADNPDFQPSRLTAIEVRNQCQLDHDSGRSERGRPGRWVRGRRILFAAGVGFDASLGQHWILGTGMTFANSFNTGARSLEVGLHAGYRWNP